MDEQKISVTLAARNFSECINRVRYQGTSFLLQKNGVPVARLVPAQPNSGYEFDPLAVTHHETQRLALSYRENAEMSAAIPSSGRETVQNQEPVKAPKRPTLNW